MLHVVLYRPEIPPNTGNVIRLCANVGARLHLVHPLGFVWEDARVRRAGLDYHELANVMHHADWSTCRTHLGNARCIAVETGQALRHDQFVYRKGDVLIFGRETTGLDASLLAEIPVDQRVSLPMRPGNRSLNLSNAAAIVVYEAWRQLDFAGAVAVTAQTQ